MESRKFFIFLFLITLFSTVFADSKEDMIKDILSNANSIINDKENTDIKLKDIYPPIKDIKEEEITEENRSLSIEMNQSGLISLKKRDLNEAITYFDNAYRLNPSNPEIANNLAYAYWSSKDSIKAKEMYINSLAMDPDRSYAWDGYGKLLATENNIEDAKNCFLIYYFTSKNKDKALKSLKNKTEKESPDVKEAMLSAYWYVNNEIKSLYDVNSEEIEITELNGNRINNTINIDKNLVIDSDLTKTQGTLEKNDSQINPPIEKISIIESSVPSSIKDKDILIIGGVVVLLLSYCIYLFFKFLIADPLTSSKYLVTFVLIIPAVAFGLNYYVKGSDIIEIIYVLCFISPVYGIYNHYAKRCPNCFVHGSNAIYISKRISGYRTLYRESVTERRDRSGITTGSSRRSVPYKVAIYRYKYRCGKCNHVWEI